MYIYNGSHTCSDIFYLFDSCYKQTLTDILIIGQLGFMYPGKISGKSQSFNYNCNQIHDNHAFPC